MPSNLQYRDYITRELTNEFIKGKNIQISENKKI